MVIEGRGRRYFRICEGAPRGRGFSGRVYAAAAVPDEKTTATLALKIYRRHVDPQMVEREVLFLRRATDAKSDNIVQYVDDFQDPKVGLFVVMKPLCKEALLDRVNRAGRARAVGAHESTIRRVLYDAWFDVLTGVSRLLNSATESSNWTVNRTPTDDYDYSTAIRYVMQMAEGLGALHARRVFYGDLALRNVLVGYDDNVLLADFGVSLDDHPRGIRAVDMFKFGSMSSPPEADDPDTVLSVR